MFHNNGIPPACGVTVLGGVLGEAVSLLLLPFLKVSLSFVVEALFTYFSGSFQRKITLYVSVNLLCPGEEVGLGLPMPPS